VGAGKRIGARNGVRRLHLKRATVLVIAWEWCVCAMDVAEFGQVGEGGRRGDRDASDGGGVNY